VTYFGLGIRPSPLISRFDMNADGVVYAELTDSQLDEQFWPQP
jgi:hypothetical protein